MSTHDAALRFPSASQYRLRLYGQMTIIALAAVFASGALITYGDTTAVSDAVFDAYNRVQLAVATLLPYMISAVIAAITAIAVMNMLPATRELDTAEQIVNRLRAMSEGELNAQAKIIGSGRYRDIAFEMNVVSSSLSHKITQWKMVNRQQWITLCHIRAAVEAGHREEALRHIATMEGDWAQTAELEDSFRV
jgi:hypothetical protein